MPQSNPTRSLAAAAAALALSPAVLAGDPPASAINAGDKVSCYGLSFCHNRCGASTHFCPSRNECKPLTVTTAQNCLDKGGRIVEGDRPTPRPASDDS